MIDCTRINICSFSLPQFLPSFQKVDFLEMCGHFFTNCLYETPAEPVAFLVAAAVTRFFLKPIHTPLFGIGIALLITKLVLKIFDRYNHRLLVNFTKDVCKFNKAYPKLRLITFIFASAISFLSNTAGFLAGIALGCYGGILLDVESYKLLQRTNRRNISIITNEAGQPASELDIMFRKLT